MTCNDTDALDLLTEDCWKEVLKRVEDPKDLKSCSETCLIFEEILQRKMNEFQFGLILPHISGYLPLQDLPLLKCRLICKRWCKAIEAEYRDVFEYAYRFFSGEVTERFLQKFATHTGNPFFKRTATLVLRRPSLLAGNQAEGQDEQADPEETFHIQKLRQLLERFGNEIWTLEMIEATHDEQLAYCKNIQTVLTHLPNLRTLRVQRGFNMDIERDELDQRREMEKVDTYIAANPIPALPLLENLKAPGLNVVMMRSILEMYAPQLKSLVVGDPSEFPEKGLELGNLNKLEFSCLDASTSLYCLRELRAPLRNLCLKVIQNRYNLYVWSIAELFRNIEDLSIQYLDITIENVFLGEPGPISAEQRPFHESISTVNLSFPIGSASLNFLLYCPKLEFINMVRTRPRGGGIPAGHPNGVAESLDVNELLKKAGYDLYQSNIWEDMPCLNSFTLRNYSREDPNWRCNAYKRIEYERIKLEKGGELKVVVE